MPNVLAQAGGAVVLLEPVCSGETLYRTTQDLLADEPRRKTMAQAMANMGIPQAGEKIYETLLTLGKPPKAAHCGTFPSPPAQATAQR